MTIFENNDFEYRFSMVFEYGPGCRRLENVGRHMYGKLWPLENQALDLKQRASLPENHIPF